MSKAVGLWGAGDRQDGCRIGASDMAVLDRRLDCARHHILFWSARLDLVRCKRRESRTAGILHGIWLSFFS